MSVEDNVKLYQDISNFLELEENPYFFNLKDELQTFPDNMITRIKQKLDEIFEDESFKFKTTILNLILIHEYAQAKDYFNALKTIEIIENEISTLEKLECEHLLFSKTSVALRNIITTYKVSVFVSKNEINKAHQMLNLVIPLRNLNDENKAAVYGIRSAVFMEYGLYGNKSGLLYAKKANDIDSTNPYWFFLIGKCLGRIRRVEKPYDIPSTEERSVLKKSIEMNENYLFMLFTAEVYAETANRTFKNHSRKGTVYPNLKLSIDQLNEEASVLYRKSIEKQSDCTHVLFRVAKGFMALPYPQKNVEYAKELLLKGLQIAPRNPFGNHLLAKYYERYGKNLDLAMKHLEICVEQNVFGAHMDMLKIDHQRKQNNICDKLHELLNVYVETPRKLQILTQLASYYIFVDSDLTKACELMKECVKMNYDENIVNHRSIFVQLKEPFSLLDVLVDEIKIQMEGNKCSPEKLQLFKEFLNDMTESDIKLPKGRAKNLKEKILQEEQELQLYYSQGKNRRVNNFAQRGIPFRSTNAQRRENSYTQPRTKSFHHQTQLKEQNESHVNAVKKTCQFFDSWRQNVNDSQNSCDSRIPRRNEASMKDSKKTYDFMKSKDDNDKLSDSKINSTSSISSPEKKYERPFRRERFDNNRKNAPNFSPEQKPERPFRRERFDNNRNNAPNFSQYERPFQRGRFESDGNSTSSFSTTELKYERRRNYDKNNPRNAEPEQNGVRPLRNERFDRSKNNNYKNVNKQNDDMKTVEREFERMKVRSRADATLPSNVKLKEPKTTNAENDSEDDLMSFLRSQ